MHTHEQPAAAPRHAWVFAAAFLALALPAGAGIAAYWAGPAAAVVAAAGFVLPGWYAVPRGRALWARHRNWLLAAQALLSYLPFVVFGSDWVVGLPGLLGALLLLTVAAPVSWLLFGAALAAEGVLRLAVVGLPHVAGLSEAAAVFVVPVYLGLVLFGLVRLDGLVTQLHEVRTDLAGLTVARERLRAAERLRVAFGDRLDAVMSLARAALAALAHAPQQARAELQEAAGNARQALDQVRVMVADDRRESSQATDVVQREAAEPTVAPRLARLVLVLVLLAVSGQLVADTIAGHAGARVAAASVAAIVALVALQIYHSTSWRERARPRGWAWTLTAQLLLTGLGFFPVLHPAIHGLAGFVAGSALLLLPRHWGWLSFAAIQAAIATHTFVLPGQDAADVIYAGLVTVTTGLVVYGLSRLSGLAVELDQARGELARMAVVRERLRVARDTHDLLGMGLSGVALKCDLARRLIGRDDARAETELRALVRLVGQARADVLAVTAQARRLSLRAELDAAAQVLASAGVGVAVRAEPADAQLPAEVDAVLATLLREAVTNVLRHASARRCEITLTVDQGLGRQRAQRSVARGQAAGTQMNVACLQVTNDGVAGAPPDQVLQPAAGRQPQRRPGGQGLANLSERATALGGHLSTLAEGNCFTLTVRVPLAP